jgi:hypothetical protein
MMSDGFPITKDLQPNAPMITGAVAIVEDRQKMAMVWQAIQGEVIPRAGWDEGMHNE